MQREGSAAPRASSTERSSSGGSSAYPRDRRDDGARSSSPTASRDASNMLAAIVLLVRRERAERPLQVRRGRSRARRRAAPACSRRRSREPAACSSSHTRSITSWRYGASMRPAADEPFPAGAAATSSSTAVTSPASMLDPLVRWDDLVPTVERPDDRGARSRAVEVVEPQPVARTRSGSRPEGVEPCKRVVAQRDEHVQARLLAQELRQLVEQSGRRRRGRGSTPRTGRGSDTPLPRAPRGAPSASRPTSSSTIDLRVRLELAQAPDHRRRSIELLPTPLGP